MSRIKRTIENYLKWKMAPQKIEKYFTRNCENVSSTHRLKKNEPFQVSCVQREIILVGSIEEYIKRMEKFVQEAAMKQSEIIAFPEYNVFDLFGLIPGMKPVNNYLNKKARKLLEDSKACLTTPLEDFNKSVPTSNDNERFRSLFEIMADPTKDALLTIMCNLAKKYGIYIYSGTFILKEETRLYNAGSLINRDGEIIGTQKKVHLTDFEQELGFSFDSSFQVFDLDFGRVAIPICMDASYFETFVLVKNLDADLVIIPIANNEEYSKYKALRGIWPRVQESYLFGMKPSLNGWLGGMHFTGKGGIFAPVDYAEQRDGIISISRHYEGDDIISGEIDIDKLNRLREKGEYVSDTNLVFEADYFQKTYRKDY